MLGVKSLQILGGNKSLDSTIELLARLRYLVKTEAETQYSALDKQWSHPLDERVAKGWAIEGLSVEKNEKGIIRLICETNESRFREGDLLVLHQGKPKDPNALHVELQYDGETDLEISIIRGNIQFLLANPHGWILDQDMFDSSPFYLDALNSVADSLRGRTKILPLLNGLITPKIDYARYERIINRLSETNLNDSQVEAIAQSYAADTLHLIKGPPGTGKTYVLAMLAKLLVEDGQRVLVTALTHRAIHNVLNKIYSIDELVEVCKIGVNRNIEDLKIPNYESFGASHYDELNGGYVIGATPFTLQSQRLANVEFDVILFDEASQVTLPLAIMGMLAGNKYIFVGDENQLPPVSVLSDEEFKQASIFEYLGGRGNESLLNVTYRLNEDLIEWPNKTFYDGQLISSADAAKRRLILSKQATRWDFILDPTSPLVFVDLCHKNSTVRSPVEAELVVELILALLDHKISPEEIGVVVPYRAQSRLIRSLLRRIIKDDEIWQKIVVDTVERMQGQEREVVLVSFTTASPAFAAQLADFLVQPQRINVAVTRPRSKLILVGSHQFLEGDKIDERHLETFELLRNLINCCQTITLPNGILD